MSKCKLYSCVCVYVSVDIIKLFPL